MEHEGGAPAGRCCSVRTCTRAARVCKVLLQCDDMHQGSTCVQGTAASVQRALGSVQPCGTTAACEQGAGLQMSLFPTKCAAGLAARPCCTPQDRGVPAQPHPRPCGHTHELGTPAACCRPRCCLSPSTVPWSLAPGCHSQREIWAKCWWHQVPRSCRGGGGGPRGAGPLPAGLRPAAARPRGSWGWGPEGTPELHGSLPSHGHSVLSSASSTSLGSPCDIPEVTFDSSRVGTPGSPLDPPRVLQQVTATMGAPGLRVGIPCR